MTCYDNCYGSFILTLLYCPVRCIIFYVMLHVNFMMLFRAFSCLCQLEYYDTSHGHDTVLYNATASSHFAIQFPVMLILHIVLPSMQ